MSGDGCYREKRGDVNVWPNLGIEGPMPSPFLRNAPSGCCLTPYLLPNRPVTVNTAGMVPLMALHATLGVGNTTRFKIITDRL